ncbi:pilus assembly FimT family protein [Veronia pacifica]|uniref:MSHA biogenesis protein MshA n=1 Tax=Veronia pacifica TaxID=1080227 RepID=A0A1C3E9K0_9GAMM|nr:type II secretion system protein [Veronia pacifica]ODA29896.1 hypothetical protein A8L45_21285 [Veronia pacifica]
MKRKQSGFTLIELLTTIIFLSVLSVTAAPKLTGVSSGAYINQLKSLKATITSSQQIAHTKAVIANVEDYPYVRLPVLTNVKTTFRFGYPAANYNGIGYLIDGLDNPDNWAFVGTTRSPHVFYITFSSKVDSINTSMDIGKITRSECYLKYEDVAVKGEKPKITLVVDKC